MPESTPSTGQSFWDLWWLVLLRGIVLVVLGLVFLARPEAPLTLVVLFMGAYWFVDGILAIVKFVRKRREIPFWGFGVFVGALSVAAGIVVFAQPVASALLTTTLLVYFLAFAAIVSGTTSVATGIRMRHRTTGEWYMIIGGAVSILFGILLLASPLYSILFLVKSIGVIAVVLGIVILIYAMKIRSDLKPPTT